MKVGIQLWGALKDADGDVLEALKELWRMNADGSNARRIASFFGGQGSMNVNSWSADSRHVAFVSYELTH